MLNNIFPLFNDVYILKHADLFDLKLNERTIVANCSNFNFAYNKIIAVKQEDSLIVFSTKIIANSSGIRTLEKLCETSFLSATAKVYVFSQTKFYIDFDCNIYSFQN
ncbi:MAG: hypothetical protein RSB76_00150 [Clostridia bacterium]